MGHLQQCPKRHGSIALTTSPKGWSGGMRSLQNPTLLATLKKRMGFSEVTGGRALYFRNLSMGETTGLGIKI